MKKWIKLLAGSLAALAMTVCAFPATTVKAEESGQTVKTYTVTFRAGNVGSFHTELAEGMPNVEVTENYIKFTVPKGSTLNDTYFKETEGDAALSAFISSLTSSTEDKDYIDSGYRLKAISDWAPGAGDNEVKRNTEYVLDYAKLVAPVKYTIYFVDSASGEQIATPTIAYGDDGETIECTPLAVASYRTSEPTTTITLNAADDTKNVVTFRYTYTGASGTITNTVTNYVPGETVTNIVENEVPAAAPAGAAVVTPNPGNAGADANIDDNQVPLADGEDANADNGDENEADVNIEDEQVPLSDGEGEDASVTIEDEATPLAANENAGFRAYWAPIAGTVAAIALVAAVAVILLRKKTQKAEK